MIIILIVLLLILLLTCGEKCPCCIVEPGISGGGDITDYKLYIYESELASDFKSEATKICENSEWHNLIKPKKLIIVDNPKLANITMQLSKRHVIDEIFNHKKEYYPDGEQINFSVTKLSPNFREIHIDEFNWKKGVKASGMKLKAYRNYVILHELGHGLGYDHSEFSKTKFNMMFQWTRGVPPGCTINYSLENPQPNENDLENTIY